MGVKTAGVGHFAIPTAPAAGTSVTSGAANVFTTTYVQLIASTAAALYITGIHVEKAAASAATYCVIQLATGAAAAETIVGQHLVVLSTGSTVALGYKQIYPPIPVGNATRISCKSADSVGAQAALVTLECIAQSNVVDDGIAVGTVNLVNTLTTYTGNTVQTGDSFARLGAPAGASHSADVAAVKVDTAAIKVKTDFLPSVVAGGAGGVFIAGSNAATTVNFTGSLSGSVGSVTGAVGSVTGNVGGNVVGSVASVTAAVTVGTNNDKTGYALSTAGVQAIWDALTSALTTVGSIGKRIADNLDAAISSRSTYAGDDTAGTTTLLTRLSGGRATNLDNLDAAISTRLAATSYTVPDNVSVAAIKIKTDQLAFTVAGQVDVNLKSVKGAAITGSGTALDPWTP